VNGVNGVNSILGFPTDRAAKKTIATVKEVTVNGKPVLDGFKAVYFLVSYTFMCSSLPSLAMFFLSWG
jgi:hypothetical protein